MVRKLIFNLCLTIGFFVLIVPQTVYAAAGDVWIYSSSNTVGTNSAFTLEVHADTDTEKLATYQLLITFDPALVNVDTSQGTDGVEAGTDGFISAVNTDNTNGTLQVIGFDTNGTGPGSNLQVLIIYFDSLSSSSGQSTINLTIDALTNELGQTIGTPNGIDGSITVNNRPASFNLVYPANGQTDLPTSLPFIWKKTTDPDGDSLTYYLYYCTDSDVTICTPVSVASSTSHENKSFFYGSMAGNWLILLAGLALIGGLKGRKEVMVWALIAMLMIGGALLPACGDPDDGNNTEETQDSDSDDSEVTQPTPNSDELGKTVPDLSTGTTYYWKVIAEDSNGGKRESERRRFTTK